MTGYDVCTCVPGFTFDANTFLCVGQYRYTLGRKQQPQLILVTQCIVGGVAQWLGRQSLAGALSLIYA